MKILAGESAGIAIMTEACYNLLVKNGMSAHDPPLFHP